MFLFLDLLTSFTKPFKTLDFSKHVSHVLMWWHYTWKHSQTYYNKTKLRDLHYIKDKNYIDSKYYVKKSSYPKYRKNYLHKLLFAHVQIFVKQSSYIPNFGVCTVILNTIDISRKWYKLNLAKDLCEVVLNDDISLKG